MIFINFLLITIHRLRLIETLGFWILFDIGILSFELYCVDHSKRFPIELARLGQSAKLKVYRIYEQQGSKNSLYTRQ
jgi:hypothetical protein